MKEHSLRSRVGVKYGSGNFKDNRTLSRIRAGSSSELKTDLAKDAYHCPESVLRVFAQGVVSEACRIRDEAASRFKGIISMDRLERAG